MDRTSEFMAIVNARRSVAPPPRPPITKSEFTAEASQIGAAIYATADKLGKLTQLAQSKSLFEDPTAEINAMTGLIKTEIVTLNAKLAELQARMRENRSRTKQRETHSTSVVESLSSQLRGATRDFQDVLHTRSANIKLLQDRRSQFSGFNGQAAGGAGSSVAGSSFGGAPDGRNGGGAPAFSGAGGFGAGGFGGAGAVPVSIFECPAAMATPAGGSGLGSEASGAGDGGDGVVIDMPAMMSQELVPLSQGNAYLESRANAVDAVQSTIAELGNIFQELGVLISEQGQNINIIDDRVDETITNVHLGRDQLMRTMNRYAGNRALIMKLFAVLFFFIVIFGAFFA